MVLSEFSGIWHVDYFKRSQVSTVSAVHIDRSKSDMTLSGTDSR
jgi:hypothetical protein